MKKSILILIAVLTLASCKKSYTCICETTNYVTKKTSYENKDIKSRDNDKASETCAKFNSYSYSLEYGMKADSTYGEVKKDISKTNCEIK